MTEQNCEILLNKFQCDVSPKRMEELSEAFKNAPDEKCEEALAVKTKSVKVTALFSSFLGLFGAGDFYLGKLKRAIAKLICNVIVPLFFGLVFIFYLSADLQKKSVEAIAVKTAVTATGVEYDRSDLNTAYKALDEAYKKLLVDESKKDTDDNVTDEVIEKDINGVKAALGACAAPYADAHVYYAGVKSALKITSAVNSKLKYEERLNKIIENYSALSLIDETGANALSREQLKNSKQLADEAEKACTDLVASADDRYVVWQKASDFIYYTIGVYLIVDVTVIAAYWVGEAFNNVNKCKEQNYNSIAAILA